MDKNGQLITLPGVIVTRRKDCRKVYIPFDNIGLIQSEEGYTTIFLNRPMGSVTRDIDSIEVQERTEDIMSPERAADFAVQFGGSFMMKMADKINTIKSLKGG